MAACTSVRRMPAVSCKTASRKAVTQKRHSRMRNKIAGTEERPRLAVHKSNEHIYAQIIDDTKGHTLASSSSLHKDVRDALSSEDISPKTVAAAEKVGRSIAEAAKQAGVEKVVFDRGGFLYHGRIQAVAEGAREAGLDF